MRSLAACVRQDHEPGFRRHWDFTSLQFLNTCKVALEPDYNRGIDQRGYHQEFQLKYNLRQQAKMMYASRSCPAL
jgi:hypothetical protein